MSQKSLRRRLMGVLCAAAVAPVFSGAAAAASSRAAWFGDGPARVRYNLQAGTANFYWDGKLRLSDVSAEARVNSRLLSSRDYTKRTVSRVGSECTVVLTAPGKPVMRQRFSFPGGRRVLVRLELTGKGLTSNWMAPIVARSTGCLVLDGARALQVPFDNDKWARYRSEALGGTGTSHEVAAFYNPASRAGLVIGSVTHDIWKTGIAYTAASEVLTSLTAFGGASDEMTHDVEPHGGIAGDRIVSPRLMAGFYDDWRDGLEDYAMANAAVVPMRKWRGGVPFGWNSWGKIQTRLNLEKALSVSDFIASDLQPKGFHNNGTAYVNLDSYWDNLSEEQLRRFVSHVHAKGQQVGIYWSPFTYWGSDLTRKAEGSENTYDEMVLRTSNGKPISLDGAFALDPTHPGTRLRMGYFAERFRRWGFDYIKLDFLTHGALEGGCRNGRRYDPSVRTGMQAFNTGMKYLTQRLDDTMFVSASIAPLFPYWYAHSRRISCDTFGGIGETEYVMNSETYGWWLSGRLYQYNDPDHIVLEGHSPAENQSRVTSAAIAGTVFLSGDDLSLPAGQGLAAKWLTNADVNAVTCLGRAFRPVEASEAGKAGETFVLTVGGTHYLAVFNYRKDPVEKAVSLQRAGLAAGADYTVTDIWSSKSWRAQRRLTLTLGPAECALLRLERENG